MYFTDVTTQLKGMLIISTSTIFAYSSNTKKVIELYAGFDDLSAGLINVYPLYIVLWSLEYDENLGHENILCSR